MAEPSQLETPLDPTKLLAAVGEEVDELRPLMTGDLLQGADGATVALVQHPCAMRNGIVLADRIIGCEVTPLSKSPLRSDWSNEPYSRMALPQLSPVRQIDFLRPVVLAADEALNLRREAVMERAGVNLLLQRWVHHNTRVVVKTVTFDEMCLGPYAEVDMTQEALGDLVEAGVSLAEAMGRLDDFFGAPLSGGRNDTWRERLKSAQNHAPARRALLEYFNLK